MDVLPGKPQMSIDEFKTRVFDQKQRLVIIDSSVLKIDDYDHFHPGGSFTLKKNYGRDVTKYFNGAYKLVNLKDEIQFVHGADARLIANSMIIANLQG